MLFRSPIPPQPLQPGPQPPTFSFANTVLHKLQLQFTFPQQVVPVLPLAQGGGQVNQSNGHVNILLDISLKNVLSDNLKNP